MKKNRLIFFSIFAAYHLVVFLFTLYVKGIAKQQDFGSLMSLLPKVYIFFYGSLMGLLLFLADFIWSWRITKETTNNEEALRLENNTLKAKIYDLQEGSKPSPQPTPATK
jgi:hypothetical protein